MIFGHPKTASSRQDNPETILICLRNILLKMYQYRCLQDIFKKSDLDERIWRMSWRCLVPNGKSFKSRFYLPFNFAIDKIRVAILIAEDRKELATCSFNYILEWLVLKYLPYLSLFISFVFPLLRKSSSVKGDYKTSRAILSWGKIETTAIFFWISDEWSRWY